jgi:hypothetical protein
MIAVVTMLRRFVRSFDLFGEPVAQLNISGQSKFKTVAGGVISIGIWAVIIAFTYVRGVKLINRDDPFTS